MGACLGGMLGRRKTGERIAGGGRENFGRGGRGGGMDERSG